MTILSKKSTVFFNNRTQNVRLPAELRLSEDVKEVLIRKVGDELIITPIKKVWYSFFNNNENQVTDDFFADGRDNYIQPDRESLDD